MFMFAKRYPFCKQPVKTLVVYVLKQNRHIGVLVYMSRLLSESTTTVGVGDTTGINTLSGESYSMHVDAMISGVK